MQKPRNKKTHPAIGPLGSRHRVDSLPLDKIHVPVVLPNLGHDVSDVIPAFSGRFNAVPVRNLDLCSLSWHVHSSSSLLRQEWSSPHGLDVPRDGSTDRRFSGNLFGSSVMLCRLKALLDGDAE